MDIEHQNDQTQSITPHSPSPFLPAAQSDAAHLLAQVQAMLAGEMSVESTSTTKDPAKEGVLIVRGRLLRPSHELFPGWMAKLKTLGYTPFLQPDPAGQTPDHVELRIAKE